MANPTLKIDDDTDSEPRDLDLEDTAPMSVEDMFEEISNDTEGNPNRDQNPAITRVAIDLSRLYEEGIIDLAEVKSHLSSLSTTEEKLEALRSLQSLVGRRELKLALFPTIEDLLSEIEQGSNGTGIIKDIPVMISVEKLHLLHMTDRITRSEIEEELSNLPSRSQKKGLLVGLKQEIGKEAFEEALKY